MAYNRARAEFVSFFALAKLLTGVVEFATALENLAGFYLRFV